MYRHSHSQEHSKCPASSTAWYHLWELIKYHSAGAAPTSSHPCPYPQTLLGWTQPPASPPWGRCCSVQWPQPENQPPAAHGSSAFPGQYQWTAWSAEAKTHRHWGSMTSLFSLSCSHSCLCPHLLISHELDGWLGCNLQHVDAIASPQRPWATLPDHLREAADDAHVVTARSVNLGDRDKPGLVPVPITTVQRFSVIQGQKGAFLFTQRFAKALIPSR